jgi:EpsG family
VALALLYGLAFCAAGFLAGRSKSSALTLLLVFSVGVLISFSRTTLTTGDLPVYIEGFEDDAWTFYYLREAPFWYLGRVITSFTGSARATFFIVDVTIVFLLARMFGGKTSIQLVILLLAFPSILGFTNIYRQLVASVLMMLALNHFRSGQARGLWLAVLACTVHIAFLGVSLSLLAAYLILRRRLWLLIALPLLGAGLLTFQPEITLLDIVGGTESRGDTGKLYVTLGVLVHVVSARLLWREQRLRTMHIGLLVYFVAGAVSLAFVPDSTGTRVMMISMYLCSFLALVVLSEHRLKPGRISTRTTILAALLIAPLIVSDSAWHLLFGYVID